MLEGGRNEEGRMVQVKRAKSCGKATSWKERGQGTMTRVGFEENEQKSNGYGTMKWIVSVMDNKI